MPALRRVAALVLAVAAVAASVGMAAYVAVCGARTTASGADGAGAAQCASAFSPLFIVYVALALGAALAAWFGNRRVTVWTGAGLAIWGVAGIMVPGGAFHALPIGLLLIAAGACLPPREPVAPPALAPARPS